MAMRMMSIAVCVLCVSAAAASPHVVASKFLLPLRNGVASCRCRSQSKWTSHSVEFAASYAQFYLAFLQIPTQHRTRCTNLLNFLPHTSFRSGSASNLALRGGAAAEPVQLQAEEVLKCDNLLGEAPMYNSEENALYWLDINGKKLWRFAPESGESKVCHCCKPWPRVPSPYASSL